MKSVTTEKRSKMNSITWLPSEMSTEEIMIIISDVNLFDEPSNSLASLCYDELCRREKEENFITISPVDEIEIEMMEEAAGVRSWLLKKIGRSTSYKIRTSGSKNLTQEEAKVLESIADSMNIEYWNWSEDFTRKYSTSGNFHRDDVVEIINTVKNLKETQGDISEMKMEAKIEFDTFCEFIEETFTDADENTAENIENTIESSPAKKSKKKSGNKENNIATKKPAILIVSSIYEKCSLVNSKFSRIEMPVLKLKVNMIAFDKMRKMQKKAPRQLKYAAQYTLNDMARDLRFDSVKEINNSMTVRNKGLTRKSITYRRASLSSISTMFSQVGSEGIAARFTGFGEQEGTRVAKRKRRASKKGRGRWRSKIPIKHRMNRKLANVSKMVRMKGVGNEDKAFAMLSRLNREGKLGRHGDNEIFVTTKEHFGGMPKGIFRFGKPRRKNVTKKRGGYRAGRERKIEALQTQPRKRSKLQPKVNSWLRRSTKKYFATSRPNKHFIRNMEKQVAFMKKFK